MSLTNREEANLAKLEEYEKYEWLVEVSQLRVGDSFGELALQEDTPRQMTIEALTDCIFATLHKTEYLKILKRIDK